MKKRIISIVLAMSLVFTVFASSFAVSAEEIESSESSENSAPQTGDELSDTLKAYYAIAEETQALDDELFLLISAEEIDEEALNELVSLYKEKLYEFITALENLTEEDIAYLDEEAGSEVPTTLEDIEMMISVLRNVADVLDVMINFIISPEAYGNIDAFYEAFYEMDFIPLEDLTLDDEDVVVAARKAFDALTEDEKALIDAMIIFMSGVLGGIEDIELDENLFMSLIQMEERIKEYEEAIAKLKEAVPAPKPTPKPTPKPAPKPAPVNPVVSEPKSPQTGSGSIMGIVLLLGLSAGVMMISRKKIKA